MFVIHNDLQLITGWAHGTTELRKWKNFVSPSNLHLNVRYLPRKLNFYMTSKWVTYQQRYKKSPENVNVRLSTANLIRMSNQEVADSRVLRNSLTSLSPFPFKACSERIIDFHFLALTKLSDKKFWPPLYSASMLDRVLPGGDRELVKQRNKLQNYQRINYQTNFPTNRVLRRFQDKNR